MNYALKYGKFRPEFNVKLPLPRWGKPKICAYNSSTILTSPIHSIGKWFNIQEIETVVVNNVTRLFIEHYNSAGISTNRISKLPITQNSDTQTISNNKIEVDVHEHVLLIYI